MNNTVKHFRRLSNRISVRIPADEDNFTGRECPNSDCKGYFKLVFGTGLEGEGLPCICPYCGHAAPHGEFWTEEQLKYVKSVALRKFTEAIHKDLKALEIDHKPRGSFGIGISLKVKKGRKPRIYHYREKKLETDVVCRNCTLRYSVYGVFAFCPDCGQHNSLQILEKNLEIIRKMLDLAINTDPELSARLIENALEDCVSSFDGFGRELSRAYGNHASSQANVNRIRFQDLDDARDRVMIAFGVDLAGACGYEAWRIAVRLFQKRHLIAHKMGVVDQQYVDRTRDRSAIVGRKIMVDPDEVRQLADLLSLVADDLLIRLQRASTKSAATHQVS